VQTPLCVFDQENNSEVNVENVPWTRKCFQLDGLLGQRIHPGRRFAKQVLFAEMQNNLGRRLAGEQDVQHV
jgi:hypothetical protein